MQSKSALRGRKNNNSEGNKFWVSWISFQKSNISWPQQPPTGKALKFNLIFHDSSKIIFVSKHQNKAEFENLVNSEVLSSNFSGLRTSAASVTSTASTTSVASMTSTPHFIKKFTDPDGSMIPGTKNLNGINDLNNLSGLNDLYSLISSKKL